jgi:ELWxxDGT repeat protein
MNRALSSVLLVLLVLFALSLDAAQGQTATLVGDFNTTNGDGFSEDDSSPGLFAVLGNRMVFVAKAPGTGFELWVTDGTPAGTRILEDICPGECSPELESLGVLGGVSLWYAGGQLWRSDGTEPGTYALDIPFFFPIPEHEPSFVLDGALYFGGCSERGCELWRSDGTPAGTRAVETLDAYAFGLLVSAGNRLYFTVVDDLDRIILWVSDGTAAGTRPVTEVGSGFGHTPDLMTGTANGRLFFALGDFEDGRELWTSDGTAAGTRALTDFEVSDPFDSAEWIKPIGNRVYLLLNDVHHGREIWRSDGTAQGTRRVTDFGVYEPFGHETGNGLGIEEIEEVGGRVVFRATDGLGPDQLWASDGDPGSTASLGGLRLNCTFDRRFLRAGGRVFLEASDGTQGCALWSTDGTPAGTRSVDTCDLPFASSCEVDLLDVHQSSVLFLNQDRASGLEIWASDGTQAGTRRLTDMPGNARPAGDFGWDWAWSGDRLFFTGTDGHGAELWLAENGETRLVADLARQEPSSRPQDFAPFGDRLFFTACDGLKRQIRISAGTPESTVLLPGFEAGCFGSFPAERALDSIQVADRILFVWQDQIWSTDGTAAGTVQLTHFTPAHSLETRPAAVQGKAFFPVWIDGRTELWRSDGTPAGTVEAFELPETSSVRLFAVGSELYFTAYQNGHYDVWRSDGTQAGTRKLTNEIRPQSEPWFTRVGSSVFFATESDSFGSALWKTDGTPAGTVEIRELRSHYDITTRELTEHQGLLYFFALDDAFVWNLWRSDGTEAGTVPLRPFQVPELGLDPPVFHLVSFAGRLYFAADGGDGLGNELWTSDGTAAGTVLLRDVLPGEGSSWLAWLTVAGGRLFFAADDGEHGHELWTSDGTAAGTRLAHDLAPEDVPSHPQSLTATDTHLYFTADDGLSGRELWSLPLANIPGSGCQLSPRHLCLGNGRYRIEATWKDFQGNTGKGTAAAVTGDTGYFWFFSPANVEVIVKVLDGTGLNGHRWVFYGALSSVEYTLTVTDTQTGLTRRYFNPPGQLASVGDTTSFGPLGAFSTTAAAGPCQPTDERLCLNNQRFAVEVAWKDFQGKEGKGKAVHLTADTGYFWFFDTANVEVVLKVLDGTALNGKHWVFYGALSSVEYTITVTDTQTGARKTYKNPSGRLASVADTGAF